MKPTPAKARSGKPHTAFTLGCSVGIVLGGLVSHYVSSSSSRDPGSVGSPVGLTLISPAVATGQPDRHTSTAGDRPAAGASAPIATDGEPTRGPCDPGQMIARLRQLAGGQASALQLSGVDWEAVAPFLAEKDPQGVFELALQLPAGRAARLLCVESLKAMAAKDGPSAWQSASRCAPGALQREAMKSVLGAWATHDPASAAQAAATIPDASPDIFTEIAGQWARRDAPGAIRWVEGLNAEFRQPAMQEAVSYAMNTGAEATGLAQGHALMKACQDAESRATIASTVAAEMVLIDPRKAFDWAASLENTDRAEALRGAVRAAAPSSPELAASQLTSVLASTPRGSIDPSIVSECVTTVARSLAETNAEAAIAWAGNLPAECRDEASSTVLTAWAEQDPVRAADWLNRQPESATKHHAALAYAARIADLDPDGALAWAQGCPPSSERERLVADIRGLLQK